MRGTNLPPAGFLQQLCIIRIIRIIRIPLFILCILCILCFLSFLFILFFLQFIDEQFHFEFVFQFLVQLDVLEYLFQLVIFLLIDKQREHIERRDVRRTSCRHHVHGRMDLLRRRRVVRHGERRGSVRLQGPAMGLFPGHL